MDLKVPSTECTRAGLPCTLHPHLAPPKAKGVRAAACDAREIVKRDFQEKFKARLGIRAFFPEPQKGGNSNTETGVVIWLEWQMRVLKNFYGGRLDARGMFKIRVKLSKNGEKTP